MYTGLYSFVPTVQFLTALPTLLMITTESMLSKRTVLRITAALFFLSNTVVIVFSTIFKVPILSNYCFTVFFLLSGFFFFFGIPKQFQVKTAAVVHALPLAHSTLE